MIYLATPYYHVDPLVRQERYEHALLTTTYLRKQGLFIYSPIVHNHYVVINGDLAGDYNFWMDYNKDFIRRSDLLVLCRIPGFEQSKGMKAELEYAIEIDKPYVWIGFPANFQDITLIIRALNVQ